MLTRESKIITSARHYLATHCLTGLIDTPVRYGTVETALWLMLRTSRGTGAWPSSGVEHYSSPFSI